MSARFSSRAGFWQVEVWEWPDALAMLGHASIQITLDTYSHVAEGMQDDAAAKLGALIFGS